MVFATAVRLLGNPADAEDIAQTVFLKAFQRFDEIGSSPAAPGWLKTVDEKCLSQPSLSLPRPVAASSASSTGSAAEGSEAGYEAALMSERPHLATDLEQAEQHDHLERRASPSPRPPARTDRALSLRRHELPGDRRRARGVAGQGEDRHPSGPRGSQRSAQVDHASRDLITLVGCARELGRLRHAARAADAAAARPGRRPGLGAAAVVSSARGSPGRLGGRWRGSPQ